MREFLKTRLRDPLLAQLRQGATPEKIATSLAWGAVIGVCPLFGISTTLAVIVGATLKLNHVALQLANYAVYLLQLALIVPFLKLGDYVFGVEASLYTVETIQASFAAGVAYFLKTYGLAIVRALVVWALATPLPAYLLRQLLVPILRRLPSA